MPITRQDSTFALNLGVNLATAALAPILLVQGRRVRRTTLELPEAQGKRRGSTGSGERELTLWLIGDSSAAGVGADCQSEALLGQLLSVLSPHYKIHYRLLANTGDTTAETLSALQQIPAEKVDIVVSALGVNHVTALHSPRRWRQQQSQLITLLRRKFRAQTLVLSGLPPMHRFPALPQPLRAYLGSRARLLDRHLINLASRESAIHVPLGFETGDNMAAADGFHPGPAAYRHWAAAIVGALKAQQILSGP